MGHVPSPFLEYLLGPLSSDGSPNTWRNICNALGNAVISYGIAEQIDVIGRRVSTAEAAIKIYVRILRNRVPFVVHFRSKRRYHLCLSDLFD